MSTLESMIEWSSSPEDARLREFGVAVWVIAGAYRLTREDDRANGLTNEATIDAVADAYRLPATAVQAALDYYAAHQSAIDARLAANAA